jgi:thioredoxin reductase
MSKIFDALIVGGGPAGVSCAVWLARLGFSAALLEAHDEVGGLCLINPFLDEWNATLPAMTGPQVAQQLTLSLERAKVPVWRGCKVTEARMAGDTSDVSFEVSAQGRAQPWKARHLVLATGVRARPLPGGQNEEVAGNAMQGVLVGPGTHIVAQDFGGKRVAVLGGGDNAFENALYAHERGASVTHLYARNIRAQHQFVRQLASETVFRGEYVVDVPARTVNGIPYDLILVFYGWEPCVAFAGSLGLTRNSQGFVQTDPATAQTSCRGVYAIGEVAQRLHPCVVTALADGVTAAKAIQARIESLGRQVSA